MTQAEQIYNKHFPYGVIAKWTEVQAIAAIQEALDSKEKELQELREMHKEDVRKLYWSGYYDSIKNFTNE